VINVKGEILPVVDIRKRFRLPSQDVSMDDLFIIARTAKRLVVLVVDAVSSVEDLDHMHIRDAGEEFPFTTYLSGIGTLGTDIVFIHDLENFLSLAEEHRLEKALIGGEA
jgi:purine-binding chemotaxis protein CheW